MKLRFPCVFCCDLDRGACTDLLLCTALWEDSYASICRNLLINGISYCKFFIFFLELSFSVFQGKFPHLFAMFLLCVLGYECQSCGNCHKADIFRDESIQILPRLDFHSSSCDLLPFANQLLEQGKQKT